MAKRIYNRIEYLEYGVINKLYGLYEMLDLPIIRSGFSYKSIMPKILSGEIHAVVEESTDKFHKRYKISGATIVNFIKSYESKKHKKPIRNGL